MSTKILIIDDEADVRAFITAVLKKKGYETVTAANGAEGLELLLQERPALVTLDIMMPGRSGIDFYRAVRKDPELSAIPIIVVSALASGGRDMSLLKPAAVFDKPIDPDEFIKAVQQALA